MGRKAYWNMIAELKTLAQRDASIGKLFAKLQKNQKPFLPLGYSVNGFRACADIYQVSQSDAEEFVFLLTVARKHWVFLEVAVPFNSVGLIGKNASREVPGTLEVRDIRKPFHDAKAWNHPVKWRLLLSKQPYVDYLCQNYFPYLIEV